jgi:hypothetical protein
MKNFPRWFAGLEKRAPSGDKGRAHLGHARGGDATSPVFTVQFVGLHRCSVPVILDVMKRDCGAFNCRVSA